MRVLQELKGEISPLECIVMQATVPDCKCDPCQEEGFRLWLSSDLAQSWHWWTSKEFEEWVEMTDCTMENGHAKDLNTNGYYYYWTFLVDTIGWRKEWREAFQCVKTKSHTDTGPQCLRRCGWDETNSQGLLSLWRKRGSMATFSGEERLNPCLARLLLLFWAHYIEDGLHLLCTGLL